jgi:hypothetical protein
MSATADSSCGELSEAKHPGLVSNAPHENDQRLKAWLRPEGFRGVLPRRFAQNDTA